MEFNLAQVHEAVERAVPDRDCIVIGELRLSYAQVGEMSKAFAVYLREVLKLQAGDRVALQMPNCLAYPILPPLHTPNYLTCPILPPQHTPNYLTCPSYLH